MNFFQKIKELANLKTELKAKQSEVEAISRSIQEKEIQKSSIEESISKLDLQLNDRESTMNNIRDILKAANESARKKIVDQAIEESNNIKRTAELELSSLQTSINDYTSKNSELHTEFENINKEVKRITNQARKFKSELNGLKEFFKRYKNVISADYEWNQDALDDAIAEITVLAAEDTLIKSIIDLPIHSDNSRELKRLSTATKKEIDNLLDRYQDRYNTKTNKALYSLMVIGLQAEMQLILFQLTYNKLSESKSKVSTVLAKYVTIATEGNQSIRPTLVKFITEIEPLYMELVDIEYRYYIYRQKEKEEQQAIREQMQQEKEERKALEAEKKKLAREESKYKTEMERNEDLLKSETDELKIAQLQNRLEELQKQLEEVEVKKEEVTSLAMGKAGYVYVISNLGSFGENVFKIGMTRRLEPQQRVDELGSASVPFRFDVHAMIFSDDAVGLENALHKRLSENRVNKVNFRKEFFKSSIDDLEILVEDIDPTADFTKTMYAEEYNQTLAIVENLKDMIIAE